MESVRLTVFLALTVFVTLSHQYGHKPHTTCAPPPSIFGTYNNARREQKTYKIGSVVKYHCKFGYRMKYGSKLLLCSQNQDTGRVNWVGDKLTCKPVTCRILKPIKKGSLNYDCSSFGCTARYDCELGYNLYGNSRRSCLVTGHWSGQRPRCVF